MAFWDRITGAFKAQGKSVHDHAEAAADARYILLQGFTHNQLISPFISVLRNVIGYEEFDVKEISIFCASLMTYCYLRYGPRQTDHAMLDTFHRAILKDMTTASLPFSAALSLYQTRYQEYSVLLEPVLDQSTDQRHHMTTLMMHACERSTHNSARGHMIEIAASSSVIGALLDDTIKFAQRLARSRSDAD